MFRINLRGDKHRAVAECTGVVDRSDLPNDSVLQQPLDARQHLVLSDSCLKRYGLVRASGDRERALHQVEQLAIKIA